MSDYLPFDAFHGPVLIALYQLGGRCETKADLHDRVRDILGPRLRHGDFEHVNLGNGRGMPRWIKQTDFTLHPDKRLRREGFVRSAGRGKWELTEEGVKEAEKYFTG